jgi:hypothetical protein
MKVMICVLLLMCAVTGVFAQTASTGVALIGGAALADYDNGQLAGVFKNCPSNRRCEYAFLAYSFTTSFAKPEALIKAVLPSLNSGQVLVVRIYLDSGANRKDHYDWCYFRPDLNADSFWMKVRNNDGQLKSQWVSQIAKPVGNWIEGMKTWAVNQKYGARMQFVVVPVLEDGKALKSGVLAPGWAYQRLVSWTAPSIPANVPMARSSSDANPDRIRDC